VSFQIARQTRKGGQGWMVELICGSHNHDLTETLVGHLYVERLTVEEKGYG